MHFLLGWSIFKFPSSLKLYKIRERRRRNVRVEVGVEVGVGWGWRWGWGGDGGGGTTQTGIAFSCTMEILKAEPIVLETGTDDIGLRKERPG